MGNRGRWLFLASNVLLASCSTINFVNGPQMDETVERTQWHHVGFNGMIEYSQPMDLDYNCAKQQWDTVTVEYSFFNGIASAAVTPVIPISLYSPWSITYKCREPID